MTKILATHPNPHLDDICGMWLLMRFHPGYKRTRIQFISQGKKILDKHVTAIGIGKGQYDEHKGDVKESATTLVWRDVKSKVKAPRQRRALEQLVRWVCDEDHAKFIAAPQHEYSLTAAIAAMPHLKGHTSRTVTVWCMAALDALFDSLTDQQGLVADWKRKKTFKTRWGKGVGLRTAASSGHVGAYAMKRGFTVFVGVNRETNYRYIKSADPFVKVNLTAAYQQVMKIDADADWYLHHSKRMLICGSDVAPESRLSQLGLDDLIRLVAV